MFATRNIQACIFRVANIDHFDGPAKLSFQNVQGFAHDGRKLSVCDEHSAFAVIELPGNQGGIKPGVEWVKHRIEGWHRIVNFYHFWGVG